MCSKGDFRAEGEDVNVVDLERMLIFKDGNIKYLDTCKMLLALASELVEALKMVNGTHQLAF